MTQEKWNEKLSSLEDTITEHAQKIEDLENRLGRFMRVQDGGTFLIDTSAAIAGALAVVLYTFVKDITIVIPQTVIIELYGIAKDQSKQQQVRKVFNHIVSLMRKPGCNLLILNIKGFLGDQIEQSDTLSWVDDGLRQATDLFRGVVLITDDESLRRATEILGYSALSKEEFEQEIKFRELRHKQKRSRRM